MRRLLLLSIIFIVCLNKRSFAQVPGIAGTNVFYAGNWLEVGEQSNGDFGAAPASVPANYHKHCAGCADGNGLAFVYDYGHDGWTVGTPALMGDYTYPGSPFEGWEIQFGATGTSRAQAFCTGAAAGTFTNVGGAGLTGAISGFTDIGGQQIGMWSGTASAGNLTIKQATEVDTFASWVVVTTKLYNTSAANIDSIYYFRSCDPDNNESWAGSAAFTTENWIDYQNDADHRVQVHATSSTPAPANQYPFALGTKDCRAVALIYEEWPMSSTQNLTPVWDKTYAPGLSWYNVSVGGPDVTEDIAMGLVIRVGTICPGDSNFVSYSYTFNGAANGIDSALPEPTLVVNNFTITPSVAPNATSDTFNTCLYPGMTVVPVEILNANTGDWTWSTWSWTTGTGLSSTTGITNSINVNSLPPYITYTITGTGYTTSCGGSGPCATRTFYLTIHTCNGATVNSPCLGDALYFNAPGDSTGATYVWLGPDSWTTTAGTTQSFTITPSVWSDTGTYHVIKTVAGTSDTSIAVVVIHPIPSVFASSNSPLCMSTLSVLSLNATPGTVPVIGYVWTGPAGFSSTLQNPTIAPFTGANAGTYSVVVATTFGCYDSATTVVVQVPPPSAPTITDPPAYCYGSPFVPFNITGVTGTVYWYSNALGTAGATTVTPTVNTSAPGTYTFYYGQTVGVCESPIDSITITVYPRIDPAFTYSIGRGCIEDTIFFTNTSTGYTSDSWNFGDGSPASTAVSPSHIYVTQSSPLWIVTLTDKFAICTSDTTIKIDTRHKVTAVFTPHLDTICFNPHQSSTLIDDLSTATIGSPTNSGTLVTGVIASFQYNFGDGSADTTLSTDANVSHAFPAPGVYSVTLTVTDTVGCTNTAEENVYVLGLTDKSWHDTTLCLKSPLYLENKITLFPDLSDLTDYTYSWVCNPASGLAYIDSADAHIPYFDNAFGSYTYTLTAELHGDWGACIVKDTMAIHSVIGKKIWPYSPVSITVNYGSSVQLNSDSLLYYWWIPDNGTLNNPNINNPVVTPDSTTTYTVYGMDQYGCVDSQFFTVTVDSDMHECIPTAFTPNNDGLNDYFHPVGLTFQNIVDFRVYNRWGQQVFYTNSSTSKGWDGTFNGVPCDMDTYFYTIIVYRPDHGDNVVYKGDVTLIR